MTIWTRIARSLVGLSLLTMAGCAGSSTSSTTAPASVDKPKPKPTVIAAVPLRLPIVEWDEYVGRLAPIETVEVRSRVSGYLASTRFEEGELVRAGDVLAVIDQRPFLSEVSRARADLSEAHARLIQAKAAVAQSESEARRSSIHRDLARKQLDRNELLKRQNATSLQELEITEAEFAQAEADVAVARSRIESAQSAVSAAQATVNIAEANVELAELNLQYTEIRSPIDGRISRRLVTEGNLVSGGTKDSTLLTTIVSLNPIHCYFDADEQTYLKYLQLSREGKLTSNRQYRSPVFLALSNERNSYPHQGHLDFVDNRMDEHTGTMRTRAILPNENLELTPGLFARIRVPGSPRHEAILIPDKAIGTDQAEKFVLAIDAADQVIRKVVTLGPMSHGLRIIRSGLVGDERVVLSGQQRARPGMDVTVTMESIKAGEELLPDVYEPVPQDKWLTPKRNPAGNVALPETSAIPAHTVGARP